MLAIDGGQLWVEDLRIRVDAKGIYEFTTDELAYSATAEGTIDCRTKQEVQDILATGSYVPPDATKPPPIFYGFKADSETISPFYLAVSSIEGGPVAIPMDRTATEF